MRTAVITGASRGLGRALARALGQRGWRVVVDARSATDLAVVEDELRGHGVDVTAVPGSVTDPEHRLRIAAAVAASSATDAGPPELDLLVNNASALGPSPLPRLADIDIGAMGEVLEVNTLAPLALIQLMLPAIRRCRGTIVNVTSDAAVEGYAGWGGYGSSKAALDQISNVLATEEPELAVYAFDPGDMRTRMHQDAFPGEDISDRPEPESVVAALLGLVQERPVSGRYQASAMPVVESIP